MRGFVAMLVRACIVLIFGAMLASTRPAAAGSDPVADAIKDLRTSSDDKLRLAATLQLAKSGDRRAVAALARALISDKAHVVRVASALGLRKLITASSPVIDISIATSALKGAQNDPEGSVRRTAKRVYAKLQRLAPNVAVTPSGAAATSSSTSTSSSVRSSSTSAPPADP